MKASIACEVFGPSAREQMMPWLRGALPRKQWAARILAGMRREFLRGKWDHQDDHGRRGTFVYYTIESGSYYEVMRRLGWDHSEHFFCKVNDDGDVVRVEREEVETWARSVV